ncbi:MAG: diacylglycerol kinase family protein [Chloroflexi bacterium]|nr:diacylglycerol kinase family protein [Chloroflexota bacterium]
MTKRVWQHIRSAANTDPSRHSPATSANRRRSLAYAAAGCAYMLRQQKNVRILIAATLVVVAMGAWLGIGTNQWAILTLTVGSVWVAEFINAAIEAAVNLATSDFHPLAKVAKDVAAAAVLISAIAAFAIGCLLFGPRLIERLQIGAIAG